MLKLIVELPALMAFPFPLRLKVAEGNVVRVFPETIAPGLTQFEVDPLSEKLLKVPVFAPVASVARLKVELDPNGIP